MTTTTTIKPTPKPKPPATLRRLFIDGRPVPASNRLANVAYRWARTATGERMNAAQLRALLIANGAPADDLTAKSWSVDIGGRTLACKAIKIGPLTDALAKAGVDWNDLRVAEQRSLVVAFVASTEDPATAARTAVEALLEGDLR
jgi:hypothetical protein